MIIDDAAALKDEFIGRAGRVLPTASPISTDPVCRISVLVPVPLNFTEFVPPLIVPAFFTVPEPPTTSMPSLPPLIVAPAAFVTSAVPALMPDPTPVIVPPLTLFTMALPPKMAWLLAPVASIVPAFVTSTTVAEMVFNAFDRILPVLALFTLAVPLVLIASPIPPVASIMPALAVISMVPLAKMPPNPPEMVPPMRLATITVVPRMAVPPEATFVWILPALVMSAVLPATIALRPSSLASIRPVLAVTLTSPLEGWRKIRP